LLDFRGVHVKVPEIGTIRKPTQSRFHFCMYNW
jgi:hypothetical protein